MRLERGRKKKLTVAFHFQRSNPAAWKCDACRKSGLDVKRRCGFLPEERRGEPATVWVRGRVSTDECPKSLITPESMQLLEAFHAWKLGGGALWDRPAKEAEALLTLENEWREEMQHGG